MNFEEIMDNVDAHNKNQMLAETIQTRFVPMFAEALARRGYIVDLHVEHLGISINIIVARGNQWLAEYAIMSDGSGPYWTPVYRQ